MNKKRQPRRKTTETLHKAQSRLQARMKEGTSELRTANEELRREIQRRKGLEGMIFEISDREQQRLGQELHDGLCQHLTAVAFMARSVGLRLKNHRVIEVADIEKIAQLVNDAATDTRNLSRALHRGIWLTGKSGGYPAGWNSNRPSILRVTSRQVSSTALLVKRSLMPTNILKRE